MTTILLILALLAAFVLTLLGFDVFHADDPHLFGWLGLTLVFFVAAHFPLGDYFRR